MAATAAAAGRTAGPTTRIETFTYLRLTQHIIDKNRGIEESIEHGLEVRSLPQWQEM